MWRMNHYKNNPTYFNSAFRGIRSIWRAGLCKISSGPIIMIIIYYSHNSISYGLMIQYMKDTAAKNNKWGGSSDLYK